MSRLVLQRRSCRIVRTSVPMVQGARAHRRRLVREYVTGTGACSRLAMPRFSHLTRSHPPRKGISPLYIISVLSKALGILEFLQVENQPRSIEEIVLRTNIPRTTAYRILKTFTHHGHLARSDNGLYRLVSASESSLWIRSTILGDPIFRCCSLRSASSWVGSKCRFAAVGQQVRRCHGGAKCPRIYQSARGPCHRISDGPGDCSDRR